MEALNGRCRLAALASESAPAVSAADSAEISQLPVLTSVLNGSGVIDDQQSPHLRQCGFAAVQLAAPLL